MRELAAAVFSGRWASVVKLHCGLEIRDAARPVGP